MDNHPYIALVDCRASNTLISSIILKDIQVTIIPQDRIITSYDRYQTNQISITFPITLQCRDKTIQQSFEIANLPENIPILIKLDLFSILGFSITGIPIDYLNTKTQLTL